MSNEHIISQRFPHLGKLSLAILEHLVEPVLGEKAISEIKAPVAENALLESIGQALEIAEKRFTTDCDDKII